MKVLSYGAGVQTFGVLVAIEAGLIDPPAMVVFADTQNEEIETYKHFGEIAIPLMQRLEIPFRLITRGNLYRDSILARRTPNPPMCTKTYKIRPIEKFLTRVFPTGVIQVMIGISTDEESRSQSKSENKRIEKIFPLLELGLSRFQVIELIKAKGYPVPPKSGCFFCPWKSKEFQSMRQVAPDKFQACLNLETHSGHKLPKYGISLGHIENQMFFDFDGIFDFDENCSTGYCGI